MNPTPIVIAAFAVTLSIAPVAALAETQNSEADDVVHRLSLEEIAEINASSEEPRIDAEALLSGDPDGRSPRRIQTEIAFGIGTGGYRELSASTQFPIGSEGFLALGFEHVEDDRVRGYHYGRGPAF